VVRFCHPGAFWDSLRPESYAIRVQLLPEHFAYNLSDPATYADTFQATTAISFNVSKAVNCVVLHASNLTFTAIDLQLAPTGEQQNVCQGEGACAGVVDPVISRNVETTFDNDLVVVRLGNTSLEAGSSPVITFTYTGVLGADTSALGLHRSAPFAVCNDSATDCVSNVLVATQLEPSGARRFFPSYDGPSYKAVFQMTVEVG
jgi:aminopeptidase N